MKQGALISKEEALRRVFAAWTPQLQTETVALADAAGRVLAQDLTAQYNIPVVRASAMDGVAIRYADVADGLPDTTAWVLGRDYARADTGDDFPDAFDTTVAIEQVTLLPGGGLRFAEGLTIRQGMNVNPSGSQLRQGDVVGRAGTVLTARDLAAIGMGGYDRVSVVRRPRVAFVPTGSELVPIGSVLQRGQNFDTNSLMAAQLLRELGAEPLVRTITRDDPAQVQQALEDLVAEADLVILNAGTSKGEEDYCGQLLERCGALFHGVAAVPGRPMSVAMVQGKPVLNISGPSLAAFYSLDWMVKPLICRFLGIPVPQRPTVRATLTQPLNCPPPVSMLCMVQVERQADGTYAATPLSSRGPRAARAADNLTANALYQTTPGEPSHEAGEQITVELLRPLI
jgi:molybdopterin molybdotransferase/putative molybdopterin biosynthesis protein